MHRRGDREMPFNPFFGPEYNVIAGTLVYGVYSKSVTLAINISDSPYKPGFKDE